MTVVKVLLGLRSPDFILVTVNKIHSEDIAGIAHILKVYYKVFLSVNGPSATVHNSMLTFIMAIEGA